MKSQVSKFLVLWGALNFQTIGCRHDSGQDTSDPSMNRSDSGKKIDENKAAVDQAVKVIVARLKKMTPEEEKQVRAIKLGAIIPSVQALLSDSKNVQAQGIASQLAKNPNPVLDALAKKNPTVAELQKEAKIVNLKTFDNKAYAPWISDLDNFPAEMWSSAGSPSEAYLTMGPGLFEAIGCVGSLALGATGVLTGLLGEMLSLGYVAKGSPGEIFGKNDVVFAGAGMVIAAAQGIAALCN